MPNPATYTPTTWVNGTTPITADNLNNIETGVSTLYANTPQTGGANTFLTGQTVSQALGGVTKTFLTFTATDGKQYAWQIDTSGHLILRNVTDSVNVATWGPTGGAFQGILAWTNALSAANQLADFEQGYGLYSDNTASTFTGATNRLWVDAPNNGEVHIGPRAGSSVLAGLEVLGQMLRVNTDGAAAWPILDGRSSTNSGIRIAGNGTVIARFQTGATGLIVNQGFQYGSGGADIAERAWTDDLTLQAGEVVCLEEDTVYGGKLARCTHPDCPGARVISTKPASLYGGELVQVEEQQQVQVPDDSEAGFHLETCAVTVEAFDDSPHWQPLAMIGRVPVQVEGAVSAYRIRQPLVSAGNGKARAWQRGDAWPLGVICSLTSDVGRRPLAPGCVLVLLR